MEQLFTRPSLQYSLLNDIMEDRLILEKQLLCGKLLVIFSDFLYSRIQDIPEFQTKYTSLKTNILQKQFPEKVLLQYSIGKVIFQVIACILLRNMVEFKCGCLKEKKTSKLIF